MDATSQPDDARETYLAVIDILGFRQLMEKPAATIAEGMRVLHTALARADADIKQSLAGHREHVEDVRTLAYADSLLVYSRRPAPTALQHLAQAVAYATWMGFLRGLPLRGAIVQAQLLVDEAVEPGQFPIFLGQGLVRAHDLERSQKWSGAIVDENTVAKTPQQQVMVDYLLANGLLVQHEVAWGESVKQCLAVDWREYWTVAPKGVTRRQVVEAGFTKLLPPPTRDADRVKLTNTLAFFDSPKRPRHERREAQLARGRLFRALGRDVWSGDAAAGSVWEEGLGHYV